METKEKKVITSITGKEMKIDYSTVLNTYFVFKGKEALTLYAPALKAHARKYGIPMTKWGHLYDYLLSEKCYLPKELSQVPSKLVGYHKG